MLDLLMIYPLFVAYVYTRNVAVVKLPAVVAPGTDMDVAAQQNVQ